MKMLQAQIHFTINCKDHVPTGVHFQIYSVSDISKGGSIIIEKAVQWSKCVSLNRGAGSILINHPLLHLIIFFFSTYLKNNIYLRIYQ